MQAFLKYLLLDEEVNLPRHRFVKAQGHPPQTLQKDE